MFYISLWTWYGVILSLIYVTLVWCGFAKRKTHQEKSDEKRDKSADLQRHYTSEEAQTLGQRSVLNHGATKERFEVVTSSPASTREDTSGLRRRFQDVVSDEDVVVEEIVEAVQSDGGLESQNVDLEAVDSTTDVVLQHFCSHEAAKIIENGLLLVSERFAPEEIKESNSEPSRSGCKLEREEPNTSSVGVFSTFAEELVRNTTGDVFRHFKQATTNEFARNLSSQVLLDAFAEIMGNNASNLFTECLDNCRAEDHDKYVNFQNIQIFAQDLSEKLLNEGFDAAVVFREAEIAKVKEYCDNFVSCVIDDGVSAACAHCKTQPSVADKSIPDLSSKRTGPISEHAEHLTNHLCQVAYQEVILSTSLQTSVSGVVENLVNGAIFEAVTKVRGETGEREDVKKPEALKPGIINSKLNLSDNEQSANITASATEGEVVEAMNEVAQLSLIESENTITTTDAKVLNGHNGVSEPPIAITNDVQSACSSGRQDYVSRRTPNRSKEPEGVCEEYENGSQNKHSGFWRQSLLLDLEEEVDYNDDSSEASGENALDKLKQKGLASYDQDSSDEESEEFIDSSEDEIIDHAEEAKLGAVGGTLDPAPIWEDEEASLEPDEIVDGLCMSRPHKHRKKSTSRPRVQSAGSHFNQAVVLDNGSGIIKLGLAGDRKPSVIQPAVVGTPQRYSLQMTGMDHKEHLKYGDVAMGAAGVMHLDYPMNVGKIENWTDIEDLWEYLLYDNLGIEEASHPVLITEVADNHPKNREKICEILFEHLSVPAMYLVNQLSLSLYASGLTTGVCLSSGFSVTQAAVIYEGHTLKHSIQQLDIAGQGLTNNMKQLLRDNKGHNFPSSSGWQIVNSMKEHLAYVSKDFAAEMKQYKTSAGLTKQYKLPDGQMVDVHSEQIQSVEPLFAPSTLLSANDTVAAQSPIHKLIHSAIKRCDPEIQEMCYRNIVLSGGSTTVPGLVSRLENELARINPKVRKIRAPEKRNLSPWIGGSILASLSTFDSMYVTVDEYADSGPRIVNQKCF